MNGCPFYSRRNDGMTCHLTQPETILRFTDQIGLRYWIEKYCLSDGWQSECPVYRGMIDGTLDTTLYR